MRRSVVDAYARSADREARHGLRVSGDQGAAWHPELNPSGFRAYLLVGKYKHNPIVSWEVNVYGRNVWMHDGMHRVYLAVKAQLKAGKDLNSTSLAQLAGVSQGYVSKCLRWLDRFGFITILGVFRGRWGRIVAKLKSIIPPVPRRSLSTGGMIKPDDDAWGSWDRAIARIEARQ